MVRVQGRVTKCFFPIQEPNSLFVNRSLVPELETIEIRHVHVTAHVQVCVQVSVV